MTQVQTLAHSADHVLAGIEDALVHRLDSRAPLSKNGSRFRGMTLVEMKRELIELHGVGTHAMSAHQVLGWSAPKAMQGTTDFTRLLAGAAQRRLRAAYDAVVPSYRVWARRTANAQNFKPIDAVRLSSAPELLETGEDGELKYGRVSDGGETYNLASYSRIMTISRESMINDNLRGFERIISRFGDSAARLENRLVYRQLTANAAMGDGVSVFHASHANLATGAASALQLSSLATMRSAMRQQSGPEGEELNLSPAFLIVPTSLEQTAHGLTSANNISATEYPPGYRRASLLPVVEPLLDAASATAWYATASAGQIDTVEYCYLDGFEGPMVDEKAGFDLDGFKIRCRLYFAAKVIDHRGLYRADGADA
jgi:hypothetical protein